MKHFKTVFCLFFIGISTILHAQNCEWLTASELGSNVSPQGSSNFAVHFFDASNGIAGGSGGKLLRTGDGGLSWNQVEDIPGNTIEAFSFPETNVGYAAGSQGMVLRTEDAGITWEALETNGFTNFNGVFFTSVDQGVIVGANGAVRRTTDGGQTWDVIPSGVTSNLNDVFFTDFDNGWAVGSSGVVLHTTDAGATWTAQDAPGAGIINSVYFTDSQTGYAAASGSRVYQTTDGGETWTFEFVAATIITLTEVFFTDADHGWVMGFEGLVRITDDGGETWTEGDAGTTLRFYDTYFTDNDKGWAVTQNGGIMNTLDGGQTWSHQIIGKTAFFDVAYITESKLVAAGSPGFLLVSENGGVNWEVKSYGSINNMEAVAVFSENLIWAAGHNGTVVHSSDAGDTWAPQSTGTTDLFRDIHFATGEKGWAVGNQGAIHHTADGGVTWTEQTSGTTQTLNAVHFLSENKGFAGGQNSTLLRTNDGGQNWTAVSPGFSNHVLSFFFLDDQTGWLSGASGNLSVTTDGGDSWTSQPVGTGNWLYDVHFISETEGIAVGGLGSIRRTTDGGASWTEVPNLSNQPYYAVDFRDAGRGIAVGSGDIRLYSCCQPSFGAETYSGCSGDGYSVTVDGTVYDEMNPEGTAFFPEGSASGCDSTVTITLEFAPPAQATDEVSACGSYTWIDGIEYTEDNSTATYTIENGAINGCDSIVSLDLTILPSPEGVDQVNACGPFEWIDGNTYAEDNNTAIFTLDGAATNGCDSIVTLDLTVLSPAEGIDELIACGPIEWIDGNTYSENNSTATFALEGAAANGCDSIVTLDLTVIQINTEIVGIDAALIAIEEGAEYQWFECIDDAFILIEGADEATFVASENGAYAVDITLGPCTDMSECQEVVGLSTFGMAEPNFSVYPNPAMDVLFVESSGTGNPLQLILYDIAGRPVRSFQISGELTALPLQGLAAGTYLLRSDAAGTAAVRVVVQ
ncbi:MAG: T9SS type A sorting domain-containing protein [Flavobacteriales bacterium]|nr:T9SS type A sorting domain-containing protein [Flavobacteriales bacterium]